MVWKKEDIGALTIPCTIWVHKFEKVFCDLGEIINLFPFFIFQNLGLGLPKQTTMKLFVDDHVIKNTVGMLYDVFVKAD